MTVVELPHWRDVPRPPPLWKTKQPLPPLCAGDLLSIQAVSWGLAVIQLGLVLNLIRGRKVVREVFTETLTDPKHYPPACLPFFFLAAHFTCSEHRTPRLKLTCPQGGSNSYFRVYKCVRTVYRSQEGLWFADPPSVMQHKPITAEPQGPCTCDLDFMHLQRLLFKKTTFDLLVT